MPLEYFWKWHVCPIYFISQGISFLSLNCDRISSILCDLEFIYMIFKQTPVRILIIYRYHITFEVHAKRNCFIYESAKFWFWHVCWNCPPPPPPPPHTHTHTHTHTHIPTNWCFLQTGDHKYYILIETIYSIFHTSQEVLQPEERKDR